MFSGKKNLTQTLQNMMVQQMKKLKSHKCSSTDE
jgi:hypothetical protein